MCLCVGHEFNYTATGDTFILPEHDEQWPHLVESKGFSSRALILDENASKCRTKRTLRQVETAPKHKDSDFLSFLLVVDM